MQGTKLPTQVVPVTHQLIVGGALATNDFRDVHHDAPAAVRRGGQDIFMSIHTSLGLVERYLVDWCRMTCSIKSIEARLGRPNYPGDEMVMEGVIVSAKPTENRVVRAGNATAVMARVESKTTPTEVEITVTGHNSLGLHVEALVALTLFGSVHER